MKTYSHYGFRRFILCLGDKGELIRRYFLDYREHQNDFTLQLASDRPPEWHGEGLRENWEITFVDTGLRTGTGARVRRVADFLDKELFMLTYGDGIDAVDYDQLLVTHRKEGRLATVTAVHPASRYGEMHVDGAQVTEFNEKPTLATGWVSVGFFAFNRVVVDKYLTDDPELLLEFQPLRSLASDGELTINRHEDFWMGMDTFRDWTELNSLWDSGNPPWKIWED